MGGGGHSGDGDGDNGRGGGDVRGRIARVGRCDDGVCGDKEVGGAWPAVANTPVSLTFPFLLVRFMDAGTDTTHARRVGPPGVGTNE